MRSMMRLVFVAHEADAEIVGWRADRAGAALGIAHEVGEVRPVCAFDDANTAALRLQGLAVARRGAPEEARRGPVPDVAGDIGQPVLVVPKVPKGCGRLSTGCFSEAAWLS